MASMTYIILDDDQSYSLLLQKTIENEFPEWQHVSTKHNTLEGLIDIQRKQPDLLFLDHYIDGLDGFDVLDLMKHLPKTIMISSEKVDTDKLAQYPNVIGFIEKPVSAEQLKKLLVKMG